jgi:hypothetical protein
MRVAAGGDALAVSVVEASAQGKQAFTRLGVRGCDVSINRIGHLKCEHFGDGSERAMAEAERRRIRDQASAEGRTFSHDCREKAPGNADRGRRQKSEEKLLENSPQPGRGARSRACRSTQQQDGCHIIHYTFAEEERVQDRLR